MFKIKNIIQIFCSHFIAARVNRVGVNHVALRMRFVTSQCTVRGIGLVGGGAHLIIWMEVVITTQRFSINLIRLQHFRQTVYFCYNCHASLSQLVVILTPTKLSPFSQIVESFLLVAVLNAEKQPLGGLPSALYPLHTCWGILLLWGGVGMGVRAML